MTVKQLINKLYAMPQDTIVVDECNDEICDIEIIYNRFEDKNLVQLQCDFNKPDFIEDWDWL